jgi:prepilin-type N-terminal cleavage/methylation domain-containing protein
VKTRGAFTLMEVILAVALLALLSGAMCTFIWDLETRRRELAAAARDQQAGGVLVERLEGDLLAGLVGDPVVGAGVQGTATGVKLLTRGVAMLGGGGGRGSGATARGGEAGGARTGAGGDLIGAEYVFDESGGVLKGRRWNAGLGAAAAGEFETISDRVERVRLRYFDGREWVESFNSLERGALPVAVEVAVWFRTGVKPKAAETGGAGASGLKVDATKPLSAATDAGMSVDAVLPLRDPDRLRVIVVPDGPSAAWKGSP